MNVTSMEEFTLVGFSFSSEVKEVLFFVFLICYMLSIAGNVLIITLYLRCPRLQIPMYFFLCNFALLDIAFISTTQPFLLSGLILHTSKISVTGCFVNCFLYFLVGITEFYLIDVMCYDRYLAICHPLHYSIIMKKRKCLLLVLAIWTCSFITNLLSLIIVTRLSFCFDQINHYFCDVGALLKNSCYSSSSLGSLLTLNSGILVFSLLVAIISYSHIILAIYKIRSAKGRQKAISTCSSHAIVVTLLFGSCMFMYLKPMEYQGVGDYNKWVSIINTVVVPLINPYIYTLRNKAVRDMLMGTKNRTVLLRY